MENVIQTAPPTVVPALYKAAAVSVIALSVAGIGMMTGVLPVKRFDAPANVMGTAQPAPSTLALPAAVPPVVAPALPAPPAAAAPVAPATAVAPPAAGGVQRPVGAVHIPAVEPASTPRPRIMRTTARNVDAPYGRATPVSTHPVEVSASHRDSGAYGQQPPHGQQPYGQPPPQPYGQPAYGFGSAQTYPAPASSSQPYPTSYPGAQAPTPVKAPCHTCGTVESIREVEKPGEGSGLGMAGGALGGAVLGKQFGNGRGRDALTILGAIGGGFAGHQAEKSYRTVTSYEVMVRMEDGSLRSIPSALQPSWRAGDRVKVEGGAISLNYS